MIKRLRRNIILVNMLLVGTVLLFIFSVVCINNYIMSESNIKHGLNQILEINNENSPKPNIFGEKGRRDFPVMLSSYIVVYADSSGNIADIRENNATIDEESLKDAVSIVLNNNDNNGEISKYSLMYAKRNVMGNIKIAFTDSEAVYSSLRTTILVCIGLFAVSLIVIFLISLALSGFAVNPVKEAWEKQKQFVADASHELKTPLTVILANNNIMMSHSESTVQNEKKWLESTDEEAHHMKHLIDQMLFLAKSDSDENQPILTDTNISEIIEADSLNFEPIAFEKNINIVTEIMSEIVIRSNATLLTQLSHILIDNAVKYGYAGSNIHIRLLRKGDCIEFSVTNFGNILSAEELEHIFDRFYRGDRSRSTGGYGLGLSIAKNISRNLNGKISVESDAVNGTTFRVIWTV